MMKRYLLAAAILAVTTIRVSSQTTSLKNNLLYDATLTPNFGIEQKTDSLSTVQLFYGLNPWRISDTKRLRHWSLMPEYRRWMKEPSSAISSDSTPWAASSTLPASALRPASATTTTKAGMWAVD